MLSELLFCNSTLKELFLDAQSSYGKNNFGPDGAKSLAGALQKNCTLTTLSLKNHNIGSLGMYMICMFFLKFY